jgi:unspecific monooxygenase
MIERAFNLNDPAFVQNPYPLLEEFREAAPFFYDPQWKQIYVSRYEDIAFLLKDKRLGRSITHILSRDELGWPPPDPRLREFHRFNTQHMLDNEPPRHTRMKALALKAFTPQRTESLRGKIEAIVDGLLSKVEDRGEMDLHDDFAEPLPVIVIAELLGVPEADRPKLRPWSAAIVKMYELGPSDEHIAAAEVAAREFSDYVRALARERKRVPGDDLISAMVQAEENGDTLSEDELVANCILLLNAGHEATVNGITAGMLALQRNPTQKQLLIEEARRNPSTATQTSPLFRTAIEELLRYDTPLPMFERYVLEDFDYKGHSFKRGMELSLIYASGNRDPRKFANADVLDVTRTDNPHLTFGLGIHYCIGAPLARLEMQVAFHALLWRFPKIQVTIDQPDYSGFVLRGIKHLPVTL